MEPGHGKPLFAGMSNNVYGSLISRDAPSLSLELLPTQAEGFFHLIKTFLFKGKSRSGGGFDSSFSLTAGWRRKFSVHVFTIRY
jgi:hypothetical protein